MKNIFAKIFFALFFAVLFFLFFILTEKFHFAYNRFKELKNNEERRIALEKENEFLRARIDYFKNPANLEKEARSLLNYKKPGEKLAIIVDEVADKLDEEQKAPVVSDKSIFLDKLRQIISRIF